MIENIHELNLILSYNAHPHTIIINIKKKICCIIIRVCKKTLDTDRHSAQGLDTSQGENPFVNSSLSQNNLSILTLSYKNFFFLPFFPAVSK